MEQEKRETGGHSDGQSLDHQGAASGSGDGAQPEPDREKPEQFQEESTSGKQDGQPGSVPAIEFSFEGRSVRTVVKDAQT